MSGSAGARPLLALVALALAASASAATIHGQVVDQRGEPPAASLVLALDPSTWELIASAEASSGAYVLAAPDDRDLLLLAIPFSGVVLDGWELHGYLPAVARLTTGHETVEHDFEVVRCREHVLAARAAAGDLVDAEALPPGGFPIDATDAATDELLLTVEHRASGTSALSLCVPLGAERRLVYRAALPAAGLLNLVVDDDGEPFAASAWGGEVVDLDRQLASAELARLEARLAAIAGGGDQAPEAVATSAAELRAAFAAAEGLSPSERAGTELEIAGGAILALEQLELALAEEGVYRYRSGELVVDVHDAAGVAVTGLTIAYEQLSHDFRFGVFGQLADAGDEVYARMRQAGLNFVTAGFYWSDIEPEQDEIDYQHIDHEVGVVDLAARGWRIKGHPLTWLTDLATPDYLRGLPFDELLATSVEHVETLVGHYSDLVHTWDVNNEASGFGASGGLTRTELDRYLDAVYAAARQTDPSAELVLNSAFDWFGVAVLQERLSGRSTFVSLPVPAFVDRALASQLDFDVVGQQLYDGGGVTLFADLGLGPVTGIPTYDLGFLAEVLRALATRAKPIHVTEISVSSSWDPAWVAAGSGYWHAPWSEQVQADFVEAFYRLAFGSPGVAAITWWDARDGYPFVANGALFRADGSPKPAFLRLESLIEGWTTRGTTTTDDQGHASIRGVAGDYRLTLGLDGGEREILCHVAERSTSRCSIVVDTPPPRRPAGRTAPTPR